MFKLYCCSNISDKPTLIKQSTIIEDVIKPILIKLAIETHNVNVMNSCVDYVNKQLSTDGFLICIVDDKYFVISTKTNIHKEWFNYQNEQFIKNLGGDI